MHHPFARINTGIFSIIPALILFYAQMATAADIPLAKLRVLKEPQAVPTLQLQDAKGKSEVKTESEALTAVHFWATWCVPCVAELPHVDATNQRYKNSGFKVVAISMDTNLEKSTRFLKEHKIKTLTPALDVNTGSFQALQIRGLPATVFLNRKGKVIARVDGPLDWQSEEVVKFIDSHVRK